MPLHDQLKQRLIGATIVVALVVAFVPMLFDEASESVPASVDDAKVEDSAPPRDVSPAAGAGDEATDEGDGYRIIPLTDSTGAAPKTAQPESTAAPEVPTEYLEDEGADVVEVPTPDSPLGQGARGVAPATAPPDKAGPKKHAAAPPAVPQSPRTGASPNARSAEDIRPPKATTSHKLTGPPAKPSPAAAPEVKRPAPDKAAGTAPRTPTSAPPVKAPAAVAKSAASVPAERRDEKKAGSKPGEAPKPAAAAKPPASAPPVTKKTDAASKPAAAADTGGNEAAATATAKTPSHATSMVARKPKADPAPTRWVVQTYSFTNEANAKILADKLRKNKFDAFVETVPGAGGVTYRVSVGPVPDKDRAEQARKRLESSVGMSGTVTGRK